MSTENVSYQHKRHANWPMDSSNWVPDTSEILALTSPAFLQIFLS